MGGGGGGEKNKKMLTNEQKEDARKKQDEWLLNFKKQKKKIKNFWKNKNRKKNKRKKQKKKFSKKLPYSGDYKKYLESPHWQKTKERFYVFFEKKCQRCESKEKINLHHTDYRKIGIEGEGDLIPLCQDCHTEFHKIYGKKNLKDNTNKFIEDFKRGMVIKI
mgnify:FL=1